MVLKHLKVDAATALFPVSKSGGIWALRPADFFRWVRFVLLTKMSFRLNCFFNPSLDILQNDCHLSTTQIVHI